MKKLHLIARLFSLASLTQAVVLVSGLLVVRILDKEQYALYSVCLGALGVITVLSTSGVTSTLLAAGGEALREGRDLGVPFRIALRLRWILAAVTLGPVSSYTAVLLIGNGASPVEALLLILGLIATALPTLTASFYRIPLQLHGRYATLQRTALAVASLRLVLTALAGLFDPVLGVVFLAIGAASAIIDSAFTARFARTYIYIVSGGDGRERRAYGRHDFGAAIRRTLPGNLAVIMGEMLVNGALTWTSNTASIAEISALSRFAVVFTVANTIVTTVASPLLAKMSNANNSIARGLIGVAGLYFAVSTVFIVATWFFRDALLWLLGPAYAGLQVELLIVSGAAAVTNFSLYGLGAVTYARGWNRWSWTYIPLTALWAFVGLTSLDLSTSFGAVWFFASLSLVRLSNQLIRLASGFWGNGRLREAA